MIWEKVTDARKRMNRARQKLFQDRNAQFWGTLGLTMSIVELPEVETMATDGVNLFYAPDFVMNLTERKCMGVIAHEISHPALRHFQRQGDRDHKLWNMAADYELNPDLIQAGLELPDGMLIDARFNGSTAEQIYNVLKHENEQAEKQGNEPRHKPGSGDMRQPVDDETGLPMSGEQKAELADKWEQHTAQALGAARKAGKMAGGHIPTQLVSVTDKRNSPSLVDWRQPLRAFIDRLGSRYSTWTAPNRRAIAQGLHLPGSRVVRPSLIGWFIDISGSMDEDKNIQAAAELQAALDDKACDAVQVVFVNTVVMGTRDYEMGDTVDVRTATKGGTDFASAMAYAAEQDFAAIVFVTDGQTSDWGNDPSCPVLWAITDTLKATEELAPPFGEKLCLYTS